VITLADNQRATAAELGRRGLVRWLGDKDKVSQTELAQALAAILQSGLPAAWSEKCRQTVDGRGAERVSAILTLDSQTPLRARLARLDDEAMILEWANNPLVRQNAFSARTIDPATHRTWFRKRLRDLDHCRLYVVETANAFPVGQVRFQKEGESWEIHYSVDARVRGRGLAKPMLQTAMLAFRSSTCEGTVFGRVKGSNTASSHVFEGLGFTSSHEGDGNIYCRLI
jgi:RimJ/RimL family protein N-acetyltransferase